MRETYDEVRVERAYAAVSECLALVVQHFRLCIGLLGNRTRTERPSMPADELRRIAEGVARLATVHADALRLLKPMEKELPGLAMEVVCSGSIKASSWAEATLFHAERYVRDVDDWTRFGRLPWKRKWELYDVVAGNLPDMALLQARLKTEESKLRKCALPAGARYRAMLLQMSPRSARLMEMFLLREGKWVEHEEVADCMASGEAVSAAAIHKAISRMKREVTVLGYPEVGQGLVSGRGRYKFSGTD